MRVSRGANGSDRSQWQAVDGHSPLEAQQDGRREPFNPSTEFLESPQSISTCPAGAIAPETGKAVRRLSFWSQLWSPGTRVQQRAEPQTEAQLRGQTRSKSGEEGRTEFKCTSEEDAGLAIPQKRA